MTRNLKCLENSITGKSMTEALFFFASTNPQNDNKLFTTSKPDGSVPTDHRSFRTGPKKILEVRSVQDLKIAKRTSKDLFFDPGTIIRVFKMVSLEF